MKKIVFSEIKVITMIERSDIKEEVGLSENRSHSPFVKDIADVLNETEILIGYWESWYSRGIALLFRDDNPVRLSGMQSNHSFRSAPAIYCLYY